MIRRDYIVRMAEEMAQVILRLRQQMGAHEHLEARATLDAATAELTRLGPAAAARLSVTELLALLGEGEPTHLLRLKALALVSLLDQAAQLSGTAGRDDEARVCGLKALELLLELQLQDADFELMEFVPRVDELVSRLSDKALPPQIEAALWRHYERVGAFAQAESVLFSLLESHPDNSALYAEAGGFYRRLLRRSDVALEQGDLPRAEVRAGLSELEALESNWGRRREAASRAAD